MDTTPALAVDVIDIRPFGDALPRSTTAILVKTPTLEVIRLVVPAGKRIAEHRARGDITVQRLEGTVQFVVGATPRRLGRRMPAPPAEGRAHALVGIEDASLLVTIALP